jgi:Bacterial membrane protein YfhO
VAESIAVAPGSRWHRALPDLLGVLWFVAVGVALLVPALRHGTHIGTYDLLSQLGLSKHSGIIPHNLVNGDQIDSMIPWNDLVWTQVHHGQIPLWNPYNGLGLPLAFDWQSAPMGMPALVGYLVPLQYSYDVGILVTLVVAGTGVYVLGRVLGLGRLACVFAGTVFELSGALGGWLGYPHGAVMSWGGWLFAAAILVVRREHRVRDISFFAVVLAMAVYSGQPEVLMVFGLGLGLFTVVLMVQRTTVLRGSGPIIRPLGDLVAASLAGLALAAPLALPGLQLISRSTRSGSAAVRTLQPHDLMYFISQGFDGLPLTGSRAFGDSFFYEETAAYVGIIAVVLAVLALSVGFRRPEVVAFAVVTVVMVAIVFVAPVNSLMNSLPVLGKVSWVRSLMAVALGVAILSGFGLDVLVRSHAHRAVRRRAAICFGSAGLMLLILFAVGRGRLPPTLASIRSTSFVGPAGGVAAGLVVVSMLAIANRGGRPSQSLTPAKIGSIAGVVLLSFETAFLLSSGVPILSSSSTYLSPTAAEASLQDVVGTATVGFGYGECGQVGIDPSVNAAFRVSELDAYDPIIPSSYYTAWRENTGTNTGFPALNDFCPLVTTSAEARLYGVSYVLEAKGSPGLKGGVFVKDVGDEALFHIPAAGIATTTPLAASGALPPAHALGVPVKVVQPDPATWRIETSATSPQVLRLRLSDVPGWHATIDGKPLHLASFAGVMLQARVPAGSHTIELHYWPSTLTIGIVLATLSAAVLVSACFVDRRRRIRARRGELQTSGSPP